MQLLKADKKKIVTQDGTPVQLRGTCVGGWMNLEDFINGYPGTESGIRTQINRCLGQELGEYFFDAMLDNFFSEKDCEFLADTGVNCVRLALNYRHFEDDNNPFVYKKKGFERLEKAVAACEKHGIYVILDMHAAPGWQNSHWHSDNERGCNLLWSHKLFQDRLCALWEELARRYNGRACIAGYNLLNEPCSNTPYGDHAYDYFENFESDWDAFNGLYRRLTTCIRAIDPDHILFLEGDNYSHDFSKMDSPFADNIVYSIHSYPPPGFGVAPYPGEFARYRLDRSGEGYWDKNRHRQEFWNSEGVQFAEKHQVPLWVGEFGSQYHVPQDILGSRVQSMDDQLAVYNEYGAHWTTWTYKDVGVMGWVTVDPASEYWNHVLPVHNKKLELGAQNFAAIYSECAGRLAAAKLSDLIWEAAGTYNFSQMSTRSSLNYCVLTGFAAASLQPLYAARFDWIREKAEIDRLMNAFHIEKCNKNTALLTVLRHRLTE